MAMRSQGIINQIFESCNNTLIELKSKHDRNASEFPPPLRSQSEFQNVFQFKWSMYQFSTRFPNILDQEVRNVLNSFEKLATAYPNVDV